MNPKLLILLFAYLMQAIAFAEDPGSAYVKNSGDAPMHVWINGVYQGYLRPGETRYTVSDGFITNDSDRPDGSGGRTSVKESHAGWENDSKDKLKVTYQFGDGIKKTSDVSVNERGEAIFAAINKDGEEAKLPSDEERENAPAILKGSKANLKPSEESRNSQAADGDTALKARFVGRWGSSSTVPSGTYPMMWDLRQDGTFIFTTQDSTGDYRYEGRWELDGDKVTLIWKNGDKKVGVLSLRDGALIDNYWYGGPTAFRKQ